jgi:hypothetical protein
MEEIVKEASCLPHVVCSSESYLQTHHTSARRIAPIIAIGIRIITPSPIIVSVINFEGKED